MFSRATAAKQTHSSAIPETVRLIVDRYRLMFEGSDQVFFYEHDVELIVKGVSESLTEVLGYSPQEVIGRHCLEFLAGDPSDEVALDLTYAALRDGLRRPPYMAVLRHKAGHGVIVEAVESPVLSNGEIVGMRGLARDVTKRKTIEKDLQRRTAYLDALILHNPLGIVVLDDRNRIEMCNPAFEQIFGFRQQDIRGLDLDDLILPLELQNEGRALTYATQMGESVHTSGARRRKNGFSVSVEVHGVPLIVDGQMKGIFGIYQDITERERAEKSVRLLSGRLLQVQDEERRRMARDLHDTTVQKLAALAMELDAISSSNAALPITSEHAALQNCYSLAEQCARELRTLSYLLHPPLLDEAGLGSAVAWYAEGYSRRSGISIEVDISPKMKRLPREMELTLFRVIQEGLTNVHKHSGGRTATISLHKRAKFFHLQIADDGQGIPPDILRSLSTGQGTMGIGIAGMRERVKQLGGRLDISCQKGTIVKVTMPVESLRR